MHGGQHFTPCDKNATKTNNILLNVYRKISCVTFGYSTLNFSRPIILHSLIVKKKLHLNGMNEQKTERFVE